MWSYICLLPQHWAWGTERRELLGFAACLSLSGKHLQVSERPCVKGSSRTPDILLWQGIPWMCVHAQTALKPGADQDLVVDAGQVDKVGAT